MFLGRVRGHIVATAKDESIKGKTLLVVEPLRILYENATLAANAGTQQDGGGARFEVTGRAIVAIDSIGAGEGQLVLVTQGSSARMAQGCNKIPTDAVIIGIVDETSVMGKAIRYNEA